LDAGVWSSTCSSILSYLVLVWTHQVYDTFYVGRYPIWASQFPEDAKNIVDLTAEFPARKSLLKGRRFLCLPSLDMKVL
jgi:hypothetical protein